MKKRIILIIAIVVIVIAVGILAAIGVKDYMFKAQYNSNGVSHFLVVTVDKDVERIYYGNLGDYAIYTEGFSECNFRTVDAKNLSIKEAIDKKLVSVDEWKKYAFSTKKEEDSLILVFDNYEIVIKGVGCLIRPKQS